MFYNGELLSPEQGTTETLPWGAVRVNGRNRPDTLGNPSMYNASFKLIGRDMVDWFGRWWWDTREGSLPIETGIGWAQVIGKPIFNNNTGCSAVVTMQLEILPEIDYCIDESMLILAQYFGDYYPRAARTLTAAIENGI